MKHYQTEQEAMDDFRGSSVFFFRLLDSLTIMTRLGGLEVYALLRDGEGLYWQEMEEYTS